MMINTKVRATVKFWLGLVGALGTAALGVFGADTQVFHLATVVVALATGAAVYLTPNYDESADWDDEPIDVPEITDENAGEVPARPRDALGRFVAEE